ncbi:MAG: hypothetical protein E7059_08670, partial [Treponema bryantii]|nr:hypothetical protein [Treponema bryantii]
MLSNQAKNNQNVSNVKKFTFHSISKVIDEIQNQKEQKNQNSQNNTNNQQSTNNSNNQNNSEQILYKVPKPEQKEDSIYRRVAKFLIIIGEDEAAKVLPHLAEEQIEKII